MPDPGCHGLELHALASTLPSALSVGSPARRLGAAGIGTLPRVGALDRLRGSTRRMRANPWLAVATAAGVLLVTAWIAFAIQVTNDNGARAGLGVLVAWPALLVALALISLPCIWAFRLIRGAHSDRASIASSDDSGSSKPKEATEPG
jgi:hypothetical protein